MPNITTNHAITYTKLVNGTCISPKTFPTGKPDYLFKIPLIPGNFPLERP